MVLVKSLAVDDASYLLLDDIGERICATWHLVPGYVRTSDSFIELACHVARAAVCTFEDAMDRVPTLLELGILRRNGTVAKRVMEELRKRGARHMGIDDEVRPPNGAGVGGEDGEDAGEEG